MYHVEGGIIQARAPAMMTEARSRAASARSPRPDKRRYLTDRRRRTATIPKQFSVRLSAIVCTRDADSTVLNVIVIRLAPSPPLPQDVRAHAGLTRPPYRSRSGVHYGFSKCYYGLKHVRIRRYQSISSDLLKLDRFPVIS